MWPDFEKFCDENDRFQERINATLVFEHIAKVMAVTDSWGYNGACEKNIVGKKDLLIQFMALVLPTMTDGDTWPVMDRKLLKHVKRIKVDMTKSKGFQASLKANAGSLSVTICSRSFQAHSVQLSLWMLSSLCSCVGLSGVCLCVLIEYS